MDKIFCVLQLLFDPFYLFQILKCSNEKIDITVTSNDYILTLEQKDSSYLNIDQGVVLNFQSESEFIFIETEVTEYLKLELKYFIPKIEDNKISILIYNQFLPDTNYTIMIVEDKNKDDDLKRKLDNECYLISLIENESNNFINLNYEIRFLSDENNKILYEEIDYSKFNSKYLLIKVFTCIEKLNLCLIPKCQRIYLENIKQEDNQKNEEYGITKIKEFIE